MDRLAASGPLLGLVAAWLFGSTAGCTCSPVEPAGPADAADTDAGTTTSSTHPGTTLTPSTSVDPCDTFAGCPPGPAPVPEPCPDWPGWETWDDYAPGLPLCVPASTEALPPPIVWEPCGPKAEMPTGCRQMKVDWPWQSTPFAYAASVDVRPDGQAVLDLVRLARGGPDEWRMKVVAEADGKVLSAMVDPRGHDEVNHDGGTFLFKTQRSLAEQAVVYYVPDADLADFYPMAVVGGAADELHPKVQWVWNHTAGAWLAATGKLWASSDGVRIGVAKWGEPWQQIFHGSEAGGLQQTTVNPFHDLVTWESSNGIYTGLMAWTPERGPYPFITYPGDHSRGAWGLGTDGVDMVWTYSKGKGPDIVPYPAGSVMTSPFTTDPAQLVPRRLRSYPSPHVAPVVPWEVGCGHAAIEWDTDKVLVVRLSDGWSWEMPVSKDGPFFSTVYAVSCDEIFLRASPMDAMNIARVKLDALGPGMPPD